MHRGYPASSGIARTHREITAHLASLPAGTPYLPADSGRAGVAAPAAAATREGILNCEFRRAALGIPVLKPGLLAA